MKYFKALLTFISVYTVFSISTYATTHSALINHESLNIFSIQSNWIDSVITNINLHYAHTSHGKQISYGLDSLGNLYPQFPVHIGWGGLPNDPDALRIHDGQITGGYVTALQYWQSADGMNTTRTVLTNNPALNVSMWCWCTQLDTFTQPEVQAYLDSISQLETEFPEVTFIYLTGNAQATDSIGYNRFQRNEQIRQFCANNNKILYDFADIDSWWLNPETQEWEHSYYLFNGQQIPVEHPHYYGDVVGHTIYENALNKGKAAWWMLAAITGWEPPATQLDYGITIDAECNSVNDLANRIGAAMTATNGYDIGLDIAEPPIPPNDYISLYFPHPEWSHPLGNNFSADIRPVTDLSDSMQVWHFSIVTDETGDMSLTFTFNDIANRPVILTDFQHSTHFPITDGESYTFTIQDTLMQFALAVGDTIPPIVSWSTPTHFEILQSDSILPLSWNYADGFQVDSIFLSYQLNGNTEDIPLQSLENIGTSEWELPHFIGINEVSLGVTAKDYAGNKTTARTIEPILIVGDSLNSQVNQGWSLWGAPIAPYDSAMIHNLADDLTDWVTYDYTNGGYTFNGALIAGRGYWLGTTTTTELDVTGEILSNGQHIDLHTGWNLVSNPLVIALAKSNLTFDDGNEIKAWSDAVSAGWITDMLYGWNGTGLVSADTLHPWKGYWLGTTQALDLNFQYVSSMEKLAQNQPTDNWVVRLKCYTTHHGFDEITVLGTAADATEGYDIPYDAPKPPPSPLGEVRLVFPHPEWNYPLGSDFAVDIRSSIAVDSSRIWHLHGVTEEQVQLTWEATNLSNNIVLELIMDDQTIINLLDVDTLIFSPAEFGTFSIRATKTSTGTNPDIPLPTETILFQNFPNPFNPETTIRFGLPADAPVRLTVYDLQGHQVWQYSIAMSSAGWHTVKWDGRDAHGLLVSTGVYFYRMQAGDFVKVKKMTLLR